MSHVAEYLIVAGVGWLRRSSEADWAVTFDDRRVRRGRGAWFLDKRRAAGSLDDLSWELELEELVPPFRTPRPLLRPVASSHLETWPVVLVSGRLGDRSLERAPGHRARLWGRRLAQHWRWAHASLPDGRWAHALAAKVPGLPPLAQHASEQGGPGMPIARSRHTGTAWSIGPYSVAADPASFVRLTYHDSDGSEVYCYHSPAATLTGQGLSVHDASYEIASRALIPELEAGA
jgi:hypothetical protein